MEEILKAISNYGFPIVVSAYLLIRMEVKMESLAQSIRELTQSILERFAKS